MRRVTIRLPEPVWEEVRREAFEHERTKQSIIAEALARRYGMVREDEEVGYRNEIEC